jgi:hypothetical protein
MLSTGKWAGLNNFNEITNMASIMLIVNHTNGLATNNLSVTGMPNHARNFNPAGFVHFIACHNTGDNAAGSHINSLNGLLGHSLLPLVLSGGRLGCLALGALVTLLAL